MESWNKKSGAEAPQCSLENSQTELSQSNLYTLYNLACINFNQTDCFRVSVYIPSGAMAFREID